MTALSRLARKAGSRGDSDAVGLPSVSWPGLRNASTVARPRVNAEAILKTAMVALEKADLPDEVMSIALCAADVDALSRGHAVEPDLLGVQGRQAPIGGLFDRLIARLGERALNFLGTERRSQARTAWSARPVTASSKQQASSAAECLFRGPRPLWLLAQPVPVRSAYFEIVSGPERIESGWWEEQHSVRDYYIARHGNGGYCWLYRNEQGWFQQWIFFLTIRRHCLTPRSPNCTAGATIRSCAERPP